MSLVLLENKVAFIFQRASKFLQTGVSGSPMWTDVAREPSLYHVRFSNVFLSAVHSRDTFSFSVGWEAGCTVISGPSEMQSHS